MLCPRRIESLVHKLPESDSWEKRDGVLRCSYCGSAHPDFLFSSIEAEKLLTPTDKSYKVYIDDSTKFYFQHLSEDERKRFTDLYNSGKIKVHFPGYFYTKPFFWE